MFCDIFFSVELFEKRKRSADRADKTADKAEPHARARRILKLRNIAEIQRKSLAALTYHHKPRDKNKYRADKRYRNAEHADYTKILIEEYAEYTVEDQYGKSDKRNDKRDYRKYIAYADIST